MDEKQLKVTLLFGADAAKAQKGLNDLENRFRQLKQRAQELRQGMEVFRATGQDASALEAELKNVEEEMRDVAAAAERARSQLQGMTAASRDVRDNLFNLRDVGQKLNTVGRNAAALGQAMMGPFLQASQAFLSTASQADPLVVRWRTEMQEIQSAWMRIGRVATSELLPLLERTSEFVDKLADFIEANPELIKIALGGGLGLKLAGEGLQTAGSLAMTAGALKYFGIIGGAGAAAGGAAGLAGLGGAALSGGVLAAAAAIGAVIGKEIANAIQSALGQKESTWADIGNVLKQLAFLASPGTTIANSLKALGDLTGEGLFYDAAKQITDFQISILGLGEAAEKARSKVDQWSQGDVPITDAELQAYINYREAERAATQRYEEQRNSIITASEEERARITAMYEERRTALLEQYAQQRATLEANYERQRNQIIENFAQQVASLTQNYALQERRAEEDYYRQRAQLARQYNLEIRRMEEDHRRQMRRMAEDHYERLDDLAAARDAYGLLEEQRRYEKERRRAEEDYEVQARRRSEDFANQLVEMEQQFALMRARRAEDFQLQLQELERQKQEQLAKLQENFNEQMAMLDAQLNEQLAKLDEGFQREMKAREEQDKKRLDQLAKSFEAEALQRRNAFARQLSDLGSALLDDQLLRRRYYDAMEADLRQFLEYYRSSLLQGLYSGVPATGRSSGGYADLGLYWLGERGREYVLSAETTQRLESELGGLTQEKIIGLMRPRSDHRSLQMTVGLYGATLTQVRQLLAENNIALTRQILQAIQTLAV